MRSRAYCDGVQRLLARAGAVVALPVAPRWRDIVDRTVTFDRDQKRFYLIARGSALECAAVLDAAKALGKGANTDDALALLVRIVSMLTKMAA